MAEKISIGAKEPLYKAAEKINVAIDEVNQAVQISDDASVKATNAENTANSVQEQFNQVVIEGDSSVEAAQARVDSEGVAHITLKERLDVEHSEVTARLAQTAISRGSFSEILTPTAYPRMIAHRGYSKAAPENSLPAYQLAADVGYWGAECDIQLTSDGVWVLMHDDTVDRTTNGNGSVSALTLADIKALSIDTGPNITKYPNLKVPTLEEFLLLCKKTGIVPMIEIKSDAAYSPQAYDNLIQLIKDNGFESRCIVISFSTTACDEVRARSEKIVIQPLLDITVANLDYVESLGNASIDAYEVNLTKEQVQLAHSRGILVNTWTVDDANRLYELVDWGVDFIATNRLAWGEFK